MDQYQKDRAIELHLNGLGYRKIGLELGVSPKTIESHIQKYKRS
jgi:DNA-binding NarL/FixJ family response regulator